ncbi:MAG: serine hydrolase, partial [Bacteroidota bacterium]
MAHYYLLTFCLLTSSITFSWAQVKPYFPTVQTWEIRSPQQVGLNAEQLQQAVDFAQTNEYEGDYDLEIAILKGFTREPYHEIKGPVKDRGKPAGVVLKNGYIVA